jgi:hypothetical protein
MAWTSRRCAIGFIVKSRKSPGREAFLTSAQMAELHDLVIEGPDRATHKVVRWRCVDLRAEVMGYSKEQMTAHGFRTSASSLLNESGKWKPDAIERALAHMVPGIIRRIYNQSAYWAEWVEMAQWWSDYPDELKEGGNR